MIRQPLAERQKETHITKSLEALPAYIRFIIDHRLIEFINLQWDLALEVESPIMKYFSALSPQERIELSLEPTRVFWAKLAAGDMDRQIAEGLEQWRSNQMPLITKDQVVAEDITKGSYVRKLSLMHFLEDYTDDLTLYRKLSAEIDYYLQVLTAETFKIYIHIQNESMDEINRRLQRNEELLLEAQVTTNMGSFEWDLRSSQLTAHTPQLFRILGIDTFTSADQFTKNVHPDDMALLITAVTSAIQDGKPYECEFRYTVDGREKLLWFRSSVQYEESRPVYLKGTLMDVTERHRTLQRLQYKDELNKQSQAITHLGDWTWDIITNKVEWSDELYRIYALEPQSGEVSFERFLTLLHPDEREIHIRRTEQALATGSAGEYDMRIIDSTGCIKVLHCRNQVTLDSSGRATKMTGTCQDITTEHKLLSKLRDGNKFAEALIDTSTDIITAFDSQLKVIAINRRACEHFSFVRQDMIGRGIQEVYPHLEPEILADMSRVLSGETVGYPERISPIDGSAYETHLMPLLNSDSQVYGGLLVAHPASAVMDSNLKISDLTYDLKQKNEQIRRNEDQLQKMVAEVTDYAIILLDTDGTIRNWNQGAEKIKGYTANEIIGKNFRLFYTNSDRDNRLPEKLLAEAVEHGRATHEGWRIRKDGTQFWGNIVITALHDDEGGIVGFSKVTRDLTERMRVEEQIREKNSLLEASNEGLKRKNKELEAFNHVASHDLQEPLRKIKMFANMIQDPGETNETRKNELVGRIITASDHMQVFIDDMLTYSQAHILSPILEPVDLNEILTGVKDQFFLSVENNIQITTDRLPVVRGIKFQLAQLFKNLIGNSIKYADKGRPLHIRISSGVVDGSELKELNSGSQYHLISFADNGIGFESEYAGRIFEPFRRLHSKSKYPGSGVGLSICHTIMQNHQGFIFAEGRLHEGATFYTAFPIWSE